VKYKDSVFIKKATYDEMIQMNLKVMDSSAIALAKDNNLILKVVSLYDK
jgi:uridylate kinase